MFMYFALRTFKTPAFGTDPQGKTSSSFLLIESPSLPLSTLVDIIQVMNGPGLIWIVGRPRNKVGTLCKKQAGINY